MCLVERTTAFTLILRVFFRLDSLTYTALFLSLVSDGFAFIKTVMATVDRKR